MAFGVAGAIDAVAVELHLGLLQDVRARFARVSVLVSLLFAVRWRVDRDGEREKLNFEWKELNGSPMGASSTRMGSARS